MSFIKKADAFSIELALIKGAIAWLPRTARQEMRAKIVQNYFAKKYLPVIADMQPKKVITEKTETIWQFWTTLPGQTKPALIDTCTRTVDKHRANMKHVVVSMDDLHKYADMPGYIMDKFHAGNIDGPHFADLVRIELLHGHGGVWMDATNFMTGPVPEWIMKQDYFMFHVPMDIPYGYYKFQNCFIRAKKNAFLLEAWRELAHEYWKDKWRNVDYFWIQLMMKTLVEGNEAANIYYNRMPHVLQDATHRLTPETFLDGPFDPALWSEIEKNSFFQKLARRRPALPGSWKEALIQMD